MNNMPWINSYPAGVRWDKDITPTPLQTILDNTVAKWPDRPAIDFMGKRLSYRELGDYVNRAACGLRSRVMRRTVGSRARTTAHARASRPASRLGLRNCLAATGVRWS